MEKRTPHYQLTHVKMLIAEGKIRSTFSALSGAAALGFDFAGLASVIAALTARDFFKFMTTHANHKIWQDVLSPHHSGRGCLPETDRSRRLTDRFLQKAMRQGAQL